MKCLLELAPIKATQVNAQVEERGVVGRKPLAMFNDVHQGSKEHHGHEDKTPEDPESPQTFPNHTDQKLKCLAVPLDVQSTYLLVSQLTVFGFQDP